MYAGRLERRGVLIIVEEKRCARQESFYRLWWTFFLVRLVGFLPDRAELFLINAITLLNSRLIAFSAISDLRFPRATRLM